MERYTVQLNEFAGPLDVLLQLIEGQQLDITRVSLAKVADQFIDYIQRLETTDPEEIADFLVVVAKLLYIKSKALLPTISLEEEGIDLEKQLKLYKEFVDASKRIQTIIAVGHHNFVHEKFPETVQHAFRPPHNVTSAKLSLLYAGVLKRLEPLVVLPKKVIEKTIHIHEKIQHIKDLIITEATLSFQRVLTEAPTKTEKIVSFLAMLELVKQRIITVEQERLFDDILIRRI